LFELMRGEPAFSDFEAAEYFQGNHDFDLLADAAAEGELSEHESSGLRLAADSEPGVPLHAEARSNGGYGSAFVAPGKPASLPPLPLPPTTLPAPAVPLPTLPTLPSPGQRLAVPVLAPTPRPGNPIDQWLKSDALPPPVIAEAP